MSSLSVDIDFDDILSSMGKYDRITFFECMQEDGYISKLCKISKDGVLEAPLNLERAYLAESEDEFNKALQAMFNQGWRMCTEDTALIIAISKKYVL